MDIIWKNWSGTQTARPKDYHRPSSEDEISNLVQECYHKSEAIKVIGSGHSCSDIGCVSEEGHLLSLENYNRVLSIDNGSMEITVEAGATLEKISATLAAFGLALPCLGSICQQTVAGAISTGTHGTGRECGNLAATIKKMKIIKGSGQSVLLTDQDEELRAASVSLGALGVISTVTLQCVKSFMLESHEESKKFSEVLNHLDVYLKNEFFRFWWCPYTPYVQTWVANRVENTRPIPGNNRANWFKDILYGNHVHEAVLWGASFFPSIPSAANSLIYSLFYRKNQKKMGESKEIFTFPILIKQVVMEYAIPLRNTQKTLEAMAKWIMDNKPVAHLPIEVRFTPGDKNWLSQAYERDTCYIGVIMYRPYEKDIPYRDYFQAMGKILQEFEGRPHWAKIHYMSKEDLQKVYPRWKDFFALRSQWDPKGIFLNPYLKRLLE